MDLIIRTSDRGTFKRCRTLWDFQSPLRQNYEYVGKKQNINFIFGSAVHYANSFFYNPNTWHLDLASSKTLTKAAFFNYIEEVQKNNLLDKTTIDELNALGSGIFNHFFEEYAEQDKEDWTPLYSELEFEVELDLDRLKLINTDITKVLYQGTIDLVAINNQTGLLWEWDHKTAGRRKENHSWLFLDTQFATYIWALRKLGIDVVGLIYNEIYKGFPKPPNVNKNGTLSKNKQQDTTYKIFVETLQKHKLKAKPYEEYLAWLQRTEQPYIFRQPIEKTVTEINTEEEQIYKEISDMLNAPGIYNTAGEFQCNNCDFLEPCILKLQNKHEWFLENTKFYRKR